MFEAWQIVIIVLLSLIDALVASFGVVLTAYYKHNLTRRLCTIQLQRRREELLCKLDAMRKGIYSEDFEDGEEEIDDVDEEYDADDIETEVAATDSAEQNAFGVKLRILPVKEMTAKMRSDFALSGVEYDEKKYYAKYTYSFAAKLRGADDEVKEYYSAFMNEIALYKGLKTRESAKQVRIYKGVKTLGLLLFRGKSLWVAYALDPAAYADTKYRGKDMSDKKRFEQTPMLLKIGSRKKLGYAQILLEQLAEKNTILLNDEPKTVEFNLNSMTDGELYDEGLLRIKIVKEYNDGAICSNNDSGIDQRRVN